MDFRLEPKFQLLVLFRHFRDYRVFPAGNGPLRGGGYYTVGTGRYSLGQKNYHEKKFNFLFVKELLLINCYYMHSERF